MDHKLLSTDELINLGILQEINRRILHPIGLCLSVDIDNYRIYGVIDCRDDPEGLIFNDSNLSREKAEKFDKLYHSKYIERQSKLGFHIQPIK